MTIRGFISMATGRLLSSMTSCASALATRVPRQPVRDVGPAGPPFTTGPAVRWLVARPARPTRDSGRSPQDITVSPAPAHAQARGRIPPNGFGTAR